MESLESILLFCRQSGRICPRPDLWNGLWEMLPNKSRDGAGWEPPLPLILNAWWFTSDSEKALRLKEHIEWAVKHQSLNVVAEYLRSLQESDWHHIGD